MDMPYVHIEAPYTSSRAFVCAHKAPLYGAVGLNSSIPHIKSTHPFNDNQNTF